MSSKLNLLTMPSITIEDGQQLIPTDKRGALLIYLAYCEDWVQREQISFLFWPDKDDKTARRNLRQLISRTKKLNFAEDIELDDQHLRWSIFLDTTQFKKAIAEQNWQQAIDLYQGGFCDAYSVTDANGFQDWVQLEREGYTSAFAGAVRQYTNVLLEQGEYEQAATLLKRVLQQDDLAEDMLQRYLQAAYLDGHKETALQIYKEFRQRLKEELDLNPLSETQAIVKAIKDSETLDISKKRTGNKPVVPLSIMRPPNLVGREGIIETVLDTDANLITLIGEAGIGKTRLMVELAPTALLIKAQEGLENVPFNAIASFIKEQQEQPLEQLGPYLDDLVRLIPEIEPTLQPGPTDPLTAKQRLLEAMALYFETLASKEGFAIAFDDIQWFDTSSIELFMFLHNRGSLKLIASGRKHEMSEALLRTLSTLPSSQTVELEPLGKENIATLLVQLMDNESESNSKPELFANWLHKNTGGNIMFVLETLKSLFEAGDLQVDQDGWHSNLDAITQDYSELAIPKVVSELIQRRLEPLGEEVKRVLQAASVIGKDFSSKLLSQITGLSEWSVIEALEVSQNTEIIEKQTFLHDLLRQSIYTNLTKSKKEFLHGRVAENLKGNDDLLIAEHWLAANEQSNAAVAILKVAQQQRKIGLQIEALNTMDRVLGFELEEELEYELKTLQNQLLLDLGHINEAEQGFKELFCEALSPDKQVFNVCKRLNILIRQGQFDKAEPLYQKLEKLEEMYVFSAEAQREILSQKADYYYYQGNYEKSIVLQLKCVELYREIDNTYLLAQELISLAATYTNADHLNKALEVYDEALSLCRKLDSPHMEQVIAQGLIILYTDLDRCDEAVELGLKVLSYGRYEPTDYVRNNLSRAYTKIEKYKEAIVQLEQLISETENTSLICNAWARLPKLYSKENRFEDINEAIDNALQLTQETAIPIIRSHVIVSCLEYGSELQKKAAMNFLAELDLDTLPPSSKEFLKGILIKHNIASVPYIARAELQNTLHNHN